MRPEHAQLVAELEAHAQAATSADELMSVMVGRLQERISKFHWVGFYMVERGRTLEPDVLVLGPYVGAQTPHTRIPLNQGICGAAASSGRTIVVEDVTSDPRYLACSLNTKSEIVAPIWVKNRVVGELDIDSHTPAAFGPEDRELVERCAAIVGKYLEKT